MDAIGSRIKRIREIRGYSQKYVADKIGVHVTLLQQYERGIKKPKEEQLQRIADALLIHPDFLRLPKVDSPDAILALMYEFLDCYGDVFVKADSDSLMIGLPREGSDVYMRQYFDDARQAKEELDNQDFGRWLLNYRHSHAEKVDFASGKIEKKYPELDMKRIEETSGE